MPLMLFILTSYSLIKKDEIEGLVEYADGSRERVSFLNQSIVVIVLPMRRSHLHLHIVENRLTMNLDESVIFKIAKWAQYAGHMSVLVKLEIFSF